MNPPNVPDPAGENNPYLAAFESAEGQGYPMAGAPPAQAVTPAPGHAPGQASGHAPGHASGHGAPATMSGGAHDVAAPAPGTPGGFLVQRSERLTPSEVRSASFSRAGLGRRGLDEDHVRHFLDRVENEISQLGNEKAALAEEVQGLRQRLSSGGSRGGMPPEEAHFQAVRILSQAQQTADLYVADAERYTRELAHEARLHREAILSDARGRAELMMEEAHQRAAAVAEEAARRASVVPSTVVQASPVPSGASPVPEGDRQAMEREIAYLRTYSDVYRTHLRSYLEALLKNVDEWENSERSALPVPTQPPAR
ncbi:DivIVA domain-containing protein [Actinomadura barringtoniae]|uniref:Cell wall synthesis protein Wag31 n=1 Tax=Actinomadura barringtoniae TaxID=1427535 RepID=A0A939PME8_9ACTN|nr:DivIVA domain-containing protein [Actinomadura barringtoniae]MBO2455310.1 DivIVA domain-containing protein [Actinomadura barringtoniae]